MSMLMTGDLKIHKTDGKTRAADGVLETPRGSLLVWDELEKDFTNISYPGNSPTPVIIDQRDNSAIEPDILVDPDKWDRVERDKHSWKNSTAKGIMERAKRRDDVDEEEVEDFVN